MNHLLEKILGVQSLEFVEVDGNFHILDYSPRIHRFAEHLGEVQVGQDSRIYFPELIGLEDVLRAVLSGNEPQVELRAIYRETPTGEPLYFNFYAIPKTDNSPNGNRLAIFFQDVTQQNVLERKYVQITNDLTLVNRNLSVYKNYLQYIIKYMADALLVTNALGQIEQCNHAAQDLLEMSEDELVDIPIHQVFQNPKLFPSQSEVPDNILTRQTLKDLEVNFSKQSGLNLTILFNCSLIKIDNENKFVYIGRDITERKRVEKEMEIALQKERELNELKSNFLSMTSHEFRTPLTVILSAAELLEVHRQKASDTQSLKYIDQIQTSVENLLELLDNLLILGKADANKLTVQRKKVDLEKFCQELIEKLELGSKNSRIVLVNQCQENVWKIDIKLLDHILNNLLSNALKYSPIEPPIYLRLSQEQDTLRFEVEDQGIGILLEDQKHLFELFHRGKNVGNIPGNGLGLAIVKKSVEIYGGSVMVSSEAGVGTIFKVNLPLK
jgi:two-component system, OmpR family, sensor histidine kinase VicK